MNICCYYFYFSLFNFIWTAEIQSVKIKEARKKWLKKKARLKCAKNDTVTKEFNDF